MKVNVNVLENVSMIELFDKFEVVCEENGVYEIEVGCRNVCEDVRKVDVVDGFIEVKSVDDIRKVVLDGIDDEDEIEELEEYVYSGVGVLNGKKVYVEVYYEEVVSYYVKVER